MFFPMRCGWVLCQAWLSTAVISGVCLAQAGALDSEPQDTQVVAPDVALRPAEQTSASFRLPPGFHVQAFAEEPMVRQPIAFTFDSRGRLWVVENYTYAEQPANYDLRYRDRIIILEDTDHDGRADRRRVFWAEGQRVTSVAVSWNGVYALCAPYLVFLPDRNQDDIPDGPPQILLDGWNDQAVRHNIVNGLRWGPDGWLYGRHGILATSWVGKPGTSPDQRVPINCGIWRYHPEKKLFEVVCHGTTNPWGMDWTEEGELLFSNTVIGHLWHVFPGAHFERMYGEDLKPHLYHLIGQAADHFHWHTAENWSDIRRGMTAATDSAGGGHAHCGLLIYQADNWPEQYHGKALMLNLHGRRINCDRLEPLGSSFVARHEPDVLRVDDPWFRGVDLQLGPDGAVWIADWCDVGECHENDGVHRNSGRIFRVWYGPAPKPRLPVWNNLTAEELLDWLQSPNAWHVGQVLAELARRRAEGGPMPSAEQFGRKFQVTKDPVQQVRLLWASYRAGRLSADQCQQLVAHDQPAVRCWAWRLLLEEQPPEQLVPLVSERLESETHPRVAVTMLGVLPGLDSKNFWNVARRFARQSQWEGDKFFGPLLWYHVSDRVVADPEAAAGFLHDCALRNVRRWVARRLAEDWTVLMPVLSGLAHRMRTTADADWTEDVLAGWSDGLAGRRRVQAPANWGEVIERWSGSERAPIQTCLRELSVIFGDGQAASALLALAQDDQAPLDRRRRALATLVAARQPQVRPVLIALLDHRDLAADAIRGLAVWADGDWMEPLLGRFERLRPEAQNALISACVVRAASACRLLKAVKEGKVAPRHIQAFHLQQLRQLHDDEVTRLLEEIWPSQRVQLDRQQLLDFYEKELAPARLQEADWRKGAEVFRRACASCHKLFGQGGSVGPDLTGGQRHNLRYWLETILEPSAQVAENFRASTLLLADGRVLVGIIVERSQETLTVQTATDRVRLATEEVEQILPSALSLMPERLLDSLAPDEIRHLFAYLMKDAWDGHEPQNP